MPTNGLLVMGSESHGIDETIESHITQLVTIPKMGYAESLNVAVATGIVLWEWKRG
jgi:TrmH family RNA methyltransferase